VSERKIETFEQKSPEIQAAAEKPFRGGVERLAVELRSFSSATRSAGGDRERVRWIPTASAT
jgi:hypothetical protein